MEFTIGADEVEAFARSLGADPKDGVPPTYAAVYALGTTAPQLFLDEEAAVDFSHLLHAEQGFEWERQPAVGETVTAQGRVASDVDRRGLRLVGLESRCTVAGAPLCRSKALFVISGGTGRASERSSSGRSRPADAGPASGATSGRELRVTFTQEQIAAYAAASGDRNPIHLDDDVARSAGLPGVIAHGMLQMGLLARVVGPAARVRKLSCRFAGMVRPGDTVTFGAVEREGNLELSALNQEGEPVLSRISAELA